MPVVASRDRIAYLVTRLRILSALVADGEKIYESENLKEAAEALLSLSELLPGDAHQTQEHS